MASSLDDPLRQVRYHEEYVSNVSSTDYPGYDPENQYLWDLEEFKRKLAVSVTSLSNVSIEFDLNGVDASIANAFRRILIAEVPTMAIEHVYIFNNTSVVQDEVLAQRLGLVPIQVNANLFQYVTSESGNTDKNTLVFALKVECARKKNPPHGAIEPEDLYTHPNVYSGDIEWQPEGTQSTDPNFDANPPKPYLDKILLAKLRPGQAIHATCHAIKGRGEIHAKWSPVATASYRLLPRINILSPIPPQHIPKFVACFPAGVVGVRKNPKNGEDEAYIKDARKDTVSREVLRHEEFKDIVQLTRVRDYFLFKVETAGNAPPENLFPDAIAVMREKIQKLRSDIHEHLIPKTQLKDDDTMSD